MKSAASAYRLLFLIALSTAAAAAQTARTPPPGDLPIRPHCTITTTDIEGVMDNFGGGIDPTTPSPALLAFLNSVPPRSQFDQVGCNVHFGESFHLCSCETCGAKLEIRVKKCGTAPDQQNNDGYNIGVAPFTPTAAKQIANGHVWLPGDPNEKTLVFNFTQQQLSLLCKNHTTDLDVYIQDDTIVDWMRLTVLHP